MNEFDDYRCVIDSAGVEPAQVQERVENHLKNLLIKHFDPQKADSIFTVEGEVSFSRWLFKIKASPLFTRPRLKREEKEMSRVVSLVSSDSCVAGADDRTHHLEGPLLQAGWGPSRLPHAQLHCQGELLPAPPLVGDWMGKDPGHPGHSSNVTPGWPGWPGASTDAVMCLCLDGSSRFSFCSFM